PALPLLEASGVGSEPRRRERPCPSGSRPRAPAANDEQATHQCDGHPQTMNGPVARQNATTSRTYASGSVTDSPVSSSRSSSSARDGSRSSGSGGSSSPRLTIASCAAQ